MKTTGLILLTAFFISSGFAQTNLGGNNPGTETYPSTGNQNQTPSGVKRDRVEEDSMKIDSYEGKQRMEDVNNTGDDAKKKTKGMKK